MHTLQAEEKDFKLEENNLENNDNHDFVNSDKNHDENQGQESNSEIPDKSVTEMDLSPPPSSTQSCENTAAVTTTTTATISKPLLFFEPLTSTSSNALLRSEEKADESANLERADTSAEMGPTDKNTENSQLDLPGESAAVFEEERNGTVATSDNNLEDKTTSVSVDKEEQNEREQVVKSFEDKTGLEMVGDSNATGESESSEESGTSLHKEASEVLEESDETALLSNRSEHAERLDNESELSEGKGDNLMDIFSEIEKTCKEMEEETGGSSRGEGNEEEVGEKLGGGGGGGGEGSSISDFIQEFGGDDDLEEKDNSCR